jgi:primosomal protein N' (replication factor Y)
MLIDVALPLPLFRTFTYAVDGDLAARVRAGSRVVVPFRNRRELGICLGPSDGAALGTARAKAVLAAPDEAPTVSAPLLELCRWVADYYVAPIGQVLRSALPVTLTGAADPTPTQRTRRVATVARHLESLLHRERIFARAPQQRALYELLESLGGRASVEHLLELLSFSPSVLKGLVARGLVTVSDEVVARDPFAGRLPTASHAAHPPSPAQQAAIDALGAARPGEVFLLHGITGSGKTLVYIELLRRVVQEQGRTAIVLVPEIALTPQTVDRFRSVFGDRVAVLHSALGDGERYDEWLALKRGEKRIAVGARSAVFAPLENLGAIVVDEEHEASYKQGEAPRYHARELAVVRARLEGAAVVLGSATPSLESWANAEAGKYRLLSLPDRAGAGRLPTVEVVDLRAERPGDGAGRRAAPAVAAYRAVVTPRLDAAMHESLERGEQVILLLNRRGYAAFVQCGACGDVATCPQCSITLTYHRTPERLVCHYCLHREEPRTACRRCGGATLRQRGLGTQQLERLLVERFPAARVARMDVDTTSGKWAHAEILDRVGRGEVDVLLGTQMIAKGLDFPNVTLVGVIDADVGINLPDFRASERCFQLLAQVAGRAGRGPKGGRVLIQTRLPQHHAVRCAVAHDYLAFVREEAAGREQPPYPPLVRLANVVFSGLTEQDTERLAQRGADWLRRLVARHAPGAVTVIGPAPCAVERIKTRWRWHALLKAEHPGELTRVARYFLERFEVPKAAQLRVTVDRDPVSLL